MLSPALPEDFIHAIRNNSPFGDSLLSSLDTPSPTSVRLNPHKKIAINLQNLSPVSWCKEGFYLDKRPVFTLDPLYHAGVYYAQESASMVLTELISQLPLPQSAYVFDVCASPGGKTTAMLDALPANSAVLANEINRHRCNILVENLTKWGLDNVLVTQNNPSDFTKLEELFDLVLVDAPCSGEGMFRKDTNARLEWNIQAPLHCAQRQNEILESIMGTVRPGGFLIYSTCTFNSFENEDQVQFLLDSGQFSLHKWNAPKECLEGRMGLGHYFVPGRTKSEGLYLCVLHRKGESTLRKNAISPKSSLKLDFDVFLSETHYPLVEKEDIFVLNGEAMALFKSIHVPLRWLKKGVKIANLTPKGWIPSQELAMSVSISSNLPYLALNQREALQYLRGETFLIPEQPPGYYLVTHDKLGLGFIKNLGNRFNNLYPKEWRIRMQLK